MNQTFEKISLVVDERENLEDLSAKKLAILSDTSPATISRFVKSKGFNNFFEYKLNLMHGRKSALIKEKSIFDSWFKNLDQSFNEVEKDMQEIIYLLRSKNIYIWSKREYDFSARQLAQILVREGYVASVIDEYHNIDHLDQHNDAILSIGQIPKQLYRSDLNYACIVYKNYSNDLNEKNIITLKIMPTIYNTYDSINLNYRITCIQLLLGILCNELCL